MTRYLIVSFCASVLASVVSIALLAAAFVYLNHGQVGEGWIANLIISLQIAGALSLAAGIWGTILGGIGLGVRSVLSAAVALSASGLIAWAVVGICLRAIGTDLRLTGLWLTGLIASLLAAPLAGGV